MSDTNNGTTATLEAPKAATKVRKNPVKASKPKAKAKPDEAKAAKERQAAKDAGLTLVHYRILKALSNGAEHTYRQIEAKTGYYSILTAQLRHEHEGSLCRLGLAKEGVDGEDRLTFTITAKGRKAIGK